MTRDYRVTDGKKNRAKSSSAGGMGIMKESCV